MVEEEREEIMSGNRRKFSYARKQKVKTFKQATSSEDLRPGKQVAQESEFTLDIKEIVNQAEQELRT